MLLERLNMLDAIWFGIYCLLFNGINSQWLNFTVGSSAQVNWNEEENT